MNAYENFSRQHRLPEFVTGRIDRFYEQRVRRDWGGRILTRGLSAGDDAVLVNHNDYLQVAAEAEAACEQGRTAMEASGAVLMSSVFQNSDAPVRVLERKLANFMGYEDGLITQSGWVANTGLLQAITGPGVPVYIDLMAHMSLWAGAKFAGVRPHLVRHNDVDHLQRQIDRHGPGIVLIDSVYSTDGSIAPIKAFCETSERNGCLLVVDESHSLGVYGKQGEGLVKSLGLSEKVGFVTASLAKAFGGRAGFVGFDEGVRDFFLTHSYPSIFSSAVMPHDVCILSHAFELIRKGKGRRARLFENAAYLLDGLCELDLGVNPEGAQIIALPCKDENALLDARDCFEAQGVFAAPFAAPATPKNAPVLRISAHSGLGRRDMDAVINVAAVAAGKRRRNHYRMVG